MAEADKYPFRWGVGTEPDIKQIKDKFPPDEMKEGDEITYEAIAEVIKEPVGSNRWQTVQAKWRKSLAPAILVIRRDKKFIVADHPARAKDVMSDHKSGLKKVRRSILRLAWVDKKSIDQDTVAKLDGLQKQHAAIRAALQIRGGESPPPVSLLD